MHGEIDECKPVNTEINNEYSSFDFYYNEFVFEVTTAYDVCTCVYKSSSTKFYDTICAGR